MNERARGFLVAGVIVLLSVGFFWKVWSRPGEMMSRGNEDLANLFASRKAYQVENTLADGELTMWDPYSDSGAPVVGNIQNGTFYPLYLLFYIIPTDFAFGYIFWADMALGGVFCYAFLRSLKRGRAAAFFGAVVYMFAGIWATKFLPGHVMVYNNFAWIPLAFYCARKMITCVGERFSRGLFFALLGSVALTVQFFGGHTQFFLYSVFFLGLYCAFELMRVYVTQGRSRLTAGIVLAVVMFALVVPLAAIQLLPAVEYASLVMPEGRMDARVAMQGIFAVDRWIMFVLPEIFGSPARNNYTLGDPYWEICPYIGIIPLLFVWTGLLLGRGGEKWFFLLMAMVVVLFAMGGAGPVYPILGRLPGFAAFRVPGRMISMFLLPAVVLASAGVEGMLTGKRRLRPAVVSAVPALLLCVPAAVLSFRGGAGETGAAGCARVAVLAGAGIVAMFGALFGKIVRRVFAASIILLAIADVFVFSQAYLQTAPPSKIYPGMDAVFAHLREKGDGIDFRVYEYLAGLDYKQFRRARMNMVTGDIDRSKLTYMLGYWNNMNHNNGLYDALNIRFFVTPESLEKRGLESEKVGEVFVTENKNALPRAYVVGCVKSFADRTESEILTAMSGLFSNKRMRRPMNLSRCAVIEKTGGFELDGSEDARPAKIIKEKYGPNRIVVEANLDKPGFLVLSEVWYPGWKARDMVGGVTREKEVFKTNVLLRGVFLEEGRHSVEFYFDSDSFRDGRTVTFAALPVVLVLLVGSGIMGFRRRR